MGGSFGDGCKDGFILTSFSDGDLDGHEAGKSLCSGFGSDGWMFGIESDARIGDLYWIRTRIDGIFKIGMIEFVFGFDVLGKVLVYRHGDAVCDGPTVETGRQTSGAMMGYGPIPTYRLVSPSKGLCTKILAEAVVVSPNVQGFTADGTVLEIL